MKVTVCIGSSCHIKGSRQVVEQLQYLIAKNNLKEQVELGGTFCKECALRLTTRSSRSRPKLPTNSSKRRFLQR